LQLFKQKSKFIFIATTLAFACVFSLPALAVKDNVIAEASKLISIRDFKAAYELLEPLEDARAGDTDYDYLFGLAGVESGNVTRGIFALERVLAVDPADKDARAEMAKAHFMLGETEASKNEFNNVLQQNPDAETKKTIEKLLTAIQKIDGTTTTFGAYLDFGLGWDSNVNSAPGINAIAVPLFGGAILDLGNSAKEQSDNFMAMAGGISFRYPFTRQLSIFGTASGNSKINGSETEFDTSALDFNLGLQYRQSQNNFTFSLQDNQFDLNGESFRRASGATAQWLHNFNAKNQAGLYFQYSGLRFAGNRIRNADRSIIGVNAAHVFDGSLTPVLFASLYAGKEDARSGRADFFDQDIYGARLGGQLNLNNKMQFYSSVAYEHRKNDENDITFLKRRDDDQYDVTLGLNYFPARDWTIKPQFSYTKNDSNFELNQFDRKILGINVRKDFSW
jgi:outer membrane protein